MKKKILFMIINMNIGGTEKALLNMIAEMPKEKYDITILMLEKYGGFLTHIPHEVHVEYLEGYNKIKDIINQPPLVLVKKLLKECKFIKAFNIIGLHFISKLKKERSLFFKYILKDYPKMKKEYDLAVAYAGPMDFISYFVINKIKAKKKVQWIHFDITKIGFNKNFALRVYEKFDQIFVVSKEGKKKLINEIPTINYKANEFLNIISTDYIVKMAHGGFGFEDNFTGTRILTVGRLSKEKGQDLTIEVLAKLKRDGYNVRWYCIGEGKARQEYERLIREYGLENDFFLLGSKANPYPYMKECDIYVQPSRHEGYCITLAEARCFDNPIICTDFTGAKEQIIDSQTGLIIKFDEEQLYEAIIKLINNQKLKEKIKNNLQKEIIDTSREITKLTKIVDHIY